MSECSTCKQAIDCCNCGSGDTPAPVLPRCQDVDLTDGTFTNATVVVTDGCISSVQQGAAPLYTPDPCCASPGGEGSGTPGPQGPPGASGAAATVTVGTVTTLAPGSSATVTNSGTSSAAVLDFGIPAGADGASGSGTGLDGDFAGLVLQDGTVQQLPMSWPPVLAVVASGTPSGVVVTATKDASGTLTLTVDLTAYDTAIKTYFQTQIDLITANLTTLNNDMSAAQAQLTALCAGSPCP